MHDQRNTIRECRRCGELGRLRLGTHVNYPFHTLRFVECHNSDCAHVQATLELYLGPSLGRNAGRKMAQARRYLRKLMEGDVAAAQRKVEGSNEGYATRRDPEIAPTANAVHSCPRCSSRGASRYASNYGAYVIRAYECRGAGCDQRWLSAEYLMADPAPGVSLASLTDCLELLRAEAGKREREYAAKAGRRRGNPAVREMHRKRAELIRLVQAHRPRLTEDEIRTACHDLVAAGQRPTLEELRDELARRHAGRRGFRKHVEPIWRQVLADAEGDTAA